MAAELITPVDHATGMPLPILPQEILPPTSPEIANRHHHWHPSNAPELNPATLAGAALRQSRIQLVRTADHNIRDRATGKLTYHDIFKGPPLPTEELQVFKLCVLACAGYIPDEAIDLSGDEPKRVPLTPSQKDILRLVARPEKLSVKKIRKLEGEAAIAYQGLIKPTVDKQAYINSVVADFQSLQERRAGFKFHHITFGYEPIRDFFRYYAISRGFSLDCEDLLDELLHTPNEERRRFLGHKLLAEAVELATDDVYDIYAQAREEGKLHPIHPNSPRILVRNALGKPEQRERLAIEFAKVLEKRYALA